MKPIIVSTLFAVLFTFAACKKSSSSSPNNPPSDQSISFTANGNAAVVNKITIDTSRAYSFANVIINGVASIPATKDTLTFELQLFNSNSSMSSFTQFIGQFNDTTHIHQGSNLTLSSLINYNAYQDAANGANDFYTTITSNDGKTMTGTFYGSLVCFANNTGAPPTLPVTNGTFKIDLPHK